MHIDQIRSDIGGLSLTFQRHGDIGWKLALVEVVWMLLSRSSSPASPYRVMLYRFGFSLTARDSGAVTTPRRVSKTPTLLPSKDYWAYARALTVAGSQPR